MWFCIALRDINDIPKGTLLRIIDYSKHKIVVHSMAADCDSTVIMHLPGLWCEWLGLSLKL